MFETFETLVLLDRCSGVRPVHLSKRVIAMGWKQDEKWDRGGCSDTWQLEKNWNRVTIQVIEQLTLTRDLGFKFLVVDMAFYLLLVCRRSPCKFSGFTWFDMLVVHRPLPKHCKSTRELRASTCLAMTLAMKEPRPGAWHGGLWLQASKQSNKMESSDIPAVFETCDFSIL